MTIGMTEGLHAAELGEAEFMYQMFATADDASRAALGMAQARFGGGEVTIMASDPTAGFWSRAIGLGVTEPVTDAVVDQVLEFANDHRAASVTFQIAPAAQGDWERLLAERGARPGGTWVKFAGPATLDPPVSTDLRVTALDPADGELFARVMCRGFGMPLESPLPGWFAGLTGQAAVGFTAYGAWQGETLVAAGSLFAANGVGTLAGAATLPEYRGLGAQSALMARRMREAAALGCRLVTAETGTETPEKPNPSLHNMRRIGLTELYERRNWIWRPTTD